MYGTKGGVRCLDDGVPFFMPIVSLAVSLTVPSGFSSAFQLRTPCHAVR